MVKAKGDFKFAAAILAGGKATRCGGLAKGKIKLKNGKTIIDHLIYELSKLAVNEIIIVANDKPQYVSYGIEVIEDLQKNLGPIAGIEAVLTYYLNKFDATIFLPGDLPNIAALEIEQLKDFYLSNDAGIVYAKAKMSHPLCAIITNILVNQISELIENGERKIINVWKKLDAKALNFSNEHAFVNLNTLEEINRYIART